MIENANKCQEAKVNGIGEYTCNVLLPSLPSLFRILSSRKTETLIAIDFCIILILYPATLPNLFF